MALIVKCRICRKRVRTEGPSCPLCGSDNLRYIVDYWPRGRNGNRKQFTLPDEVRSFSRARELERAFLATTRSRIRERPKAEKHPTVDELFPDYLAWHHLHKAPTTWHDVSRSWENSLRPIFGSLEVREVATEHYSLFQQYRATTVSNRTINKELDYFSGFLRWCRREKKMDVPRILYDELPYSRPLPIILSQDEVSRILEAARKEPVYHALLLCLYTMGLRMSEARNLKVEDFDFGNLSIRVLQKGGTWKLLPINEQVSKAVGRLIKSRKLKIGAYVFTVRKSGKPIQNMRKALQRICKRARVTKRVHPHLFRHSIATHMLALDVNLRTIQRYLGHSQVQTTEFYTHVAMNHLRNAQDSVIIPGKGQ